MELWYSLSAHYDALTRVLESVCPGFVAAGLLLVERRRRQQPIDPKRQIEIRTLLNSIPDALMIIDPSSRIVDANGMAQQMTNLSRQQIAGMSIVDVIKKMTGETRDNIVAFKKPIANRALVGEIIGQERRRGRNPKTGEELELLISASPIRDDKGEIKGALVIARDITELSRLRQRLADIERHQAIGHVAAGIAHDFNNTLQTISQAVAVLEMWPDHPLEERKVFLEMIQNAVRRGAEVIGRIRDYLRSDVAEQDNIDIHSVLQEALELTRPMWQPRPVKVGRKTEFCGLVLGNKSDVLRVFTNLIINSLQAMGKPGELSVGCEDRGETVYVWIRDTGHGIAPGMQKRIFNPYFTTKAGGTGLGLSGAQRIMHELGGTISFTSTPGKGTQFDLTFPKVKQREEKKSA